MMTMCILRVAALALVADGLVAPRPPVARRSALGARAPVRVDVSGDGAVVKVATTLDGDAAGRTFGADGDVVVLDYAASTASGQLLDAASGAQYTVGDDRYVKGWDLAVRSLAEGESAAFECDASYAYGPSGVPPAVRGGEGLRFDIAAVGYRGNVRTSSSFASDKPLTPRTAGAIKAEYERRRDARAAGAEDAAVAKLERDAATAGDALATLRNVASDVADGVRGFYFFGFFESQTGETPPWYLRPALTFPAIFAGVGLAFYVLVGTDAILLRGDSSPIPGQDGFSL